MFKKLTLTTIIALSLLSITAQAEGSKCQAKISEKSKFCKGKACDKGKICKKIKRKGHKSPLIIPLTSPMRMLMKYENDPKLALTSEQKTKLEVIRNEVKPKMKKLKDEIVAQTKALKTSCKAGAKPTSFKAEVEKIAKLKIEATMVKLSCIEKTKEVLNEKQKTFIKELRKSRNKNQHMKTKSKCQSGKCAGK